MGTFLYVKAPIYVVDAFTAEPFRGNPAGVCLLTHPGDAEWMQNVAAEMRHAETAFVRRLDEGFELRWFTPLTEVDLCGHATLAAAHLLWELGRVPAEESIEFQTKSGLLTCTRNGDEIAMDFPSEPPESAVMPIEAQHIFNDAVLFWGHNRLDWLAEIASAEHLRELRPLDDDIAKLGKRGLIVTAKADDGVADFIYRFFAPATGVPEDPVTGSAQSCLGPYWSTKLDKKRLRSYQASARGGWLAVDYHGDRVTIWGQAITILEGQLWQ